MAPVRCSDMPSGTLRDRETLTDINRSLEQNPDNAKALAHRGENHRLTGNFEAALDDFNRSIELEPDYAWAIAHRGETYYLLKRYEEALADFNRAIELNPDYNWAIAHRGVTYEYMRYCEEALSDLNRAVEQKPCYAWAIAHRGRTYEMMRFYKEGLEDFDRAIALDETIIPHWRSERGLLLSFLERYAEAIEYYEQGLKENPDDYFALYGLVSAKTCWKGIAETQPQIEEACVTLLSAANTEARSVVLYGLGGFAALKGEVDRALSYLQEAISLDNYRADTANHDRVWLDIYPDPRFQSLVDSMKIV
ncbi:tetratricopeptide repeat protein [Microcoleus sp. N3A4]|uniref:tetratricopeptide repeat protein n=1 Tax=Microcoleus sp. N3A4 TaxID=3055379 RepID=UPI002FD0F5AF